MKENENQNVEAGEQKPKIDLNKERLMEIKNNYNTMMKYRKENSDTYKKIDMSKIL